MRQAADFQGNSYVELPASKIVIGNSQLIEFTMTTTSSDGLMFWHGQTPDESGLGKDYVAVSLADGYLQFR